MAVNIAGIVSIIVFYLLILLIGIWAARKQDKTKDSGNEESEEVILAGRNIGMFVGCFTMTATWVGGGYINGTAESVYSSGLVWVQAPWGYALSLSMGGLFFATKMREAKYITMLDPLQDKYGKVMGACLYLPALLGETFWSASILAALGATLSVILGISMNISVPISALIAVGYTFFGGLYSVAYTDIIQLICIFVGLWLCVPFAMTNDDVPSILIGELEKRKAALLAVNPNATTNKDWLGTLKPYEVGLWIDYAMLLICGGIPWQVYFQRVLSSKSAGRAKVLSFVASAGCIISIIPAILIGATANVADWPSVLPHLDDKNVSQYLKQDKDGNLLNALKDKRLVLPMVLQYLTPGWVAFIGLGAVSAAVMSSADSSVLSASSMFSHNIYVTIFRPKASQKEVIWVLRLTIFVVGCIATVIGLTFDSIYILFHLCSDLVFVVLFPQLLCAVHVPWVNTYGSIAGVIVGMFFRLTGGEEMIGFKAAIKYPGYKYNMITNDDGTTEMVGKQYFPFRTMSMILSLLALLAVSKLFNYMLEKGIMSEERDFLNVLQRREKERHLVKVNGEEKREGNGDVHMDDLQEEKENGKLIHEQNGNGVHA